MSSLGTWRPRTIGILISGLVLIAAAIVVVFIVNAYQKTDQVSIASGVFNVRLATTDVARKQGLSGVTSLKPNQGLLMVFGSDDFWGIWMKDMKIPLDIIWINNEKEVVYIVTNASPILGTSKTFTPPDLTRYVLEVPAGTVKNTGIKIGDVVSFNLQENQ
jgi:uncharacterized membrane protein (UPF0127 family)